MKKTNLGDMNAKQEVQEIFKNIPERNTKINTDIPCLMNYLF